MTKLVDTTRDSETEVASEERLQKSLVKMGALEDAILTSANFSIIATDEQGVIQLFNIGAESMLGYTAEDVLNKITPADISDPQEVIARAAALSGELETAISPGFDALVFKASRGIEDIYELTYIRKDGSRFPALVSVTALRDEQEVIIGYLLIGTDNTARKQVEAEREQLLKIQENTNKQLQQANFVSRENEEKLAVTLHSIGDGVIATDARARVTLLNPLAERLTGWTQADARGRPVEDVFKIINMKTRKPARIPVADTLAKGKIHSLDVHTVLIAADGSECDIADSCAPICDRDGMVIGAVLVFRDVTGEYAAAQALRDSNELVETVLNSVGDGIITVLANGAVIATVNPAAERMFGYLASELMGKNFSMLIPELNQSQSNDSLEFYSASDEERAAGLGREVMGRCKSGSLFPMEMAVSEMWLGGQRYFTGILRDITARKQAEEALIKADALQNAIFNSANFSSIATDAKGVIQIFNVGAERMLGYTADEVMDKSTPADISDPQEIIERAQALSLELGTQIKPGFEALVFKASRGIEDIYALTYIRKDGSRFPALVSVTALRDAQNVIIGYLLIGTDNTARTQVEEERAELYVTLQDKNTELEAARLVAEKANYAKSEFLSSMSHELRTPLNAILGFAQLLESGAPPPTSSQLARLHQIIKAGWYLLDLINQILDLSVIESGNLILSQESVLLIDVMQECQAMIEAQAEQRDIQLSFLPFDTTWYASADRTRVKQVLINLLSNAINIIASTARSLWNAASQSQDVYASALRIAGKGCRQKSCRIYFSPLIVLVRRMGRKKAQVSA